MTKPSREKFINQPENPATSITERVKKLREKTQTDEVREEIRRLLKEYFKVKHL
jgi:hypothetical protein